jgi:transposase
MAHGINADIVHKWLRLARAKEASEPTMPAFLPVSLKPANPAKARGVAPAALANAGIRVEIQRDADTVIVNWPTDAASGCVVWLREQAE